MYKKYYCLHFAFLIMCIGLSCIISLPIQASDITKTNFHLLPEKNNQLLSLSWGDIWNKLRRRKGKRGSRGEDENKEFFCMIAPGRLKSSNNGKQTLVVWNTKPLFLWKDDNQKVKGIEVFHIRSYKQVWKSKTLQSGTSKVIYDGKPLKPGEAYFWRETSSPTSQEKPPSKQSFRIMGAEKRQTITMGLKQLENGLKAKRASKDKIILARVDYFADRQLWSDVLREVYSVKNPNSELKQKIKQIQSHDFCSPKKSEQKLGLVFWK